MLGPPATPGPLQMLLPTYDEADVVDGNWPDEDLTEDIGPGGGESEAGARVRSR